MLLASIVECGIAARRQTSCSSLKMRYSTEQKRLGWSTGLPSEVLGAHPLGDFGGYGAWIRGDGLMESALVCSGKICSAKHGTVDASKVGVASKRSFSVRNPPTRGWRQHDELGLPEAILPIAGTSVPNSLPPRSLAANRSSFSSIDTLSIPSIHPYFIGYVTWGYNAHGRCFVKRSTLNLIWYVECSSVLSGICVVDPQIAEVAR